MAERPRYCEECRLYPRKCGGTAYYYDYLEDLEDGPRPPAAASEESEGGMPS